MRNEAIIAVVIPALNEEQSIGKVVSAIPQWVDDIVVVDNGSRDATGEIAVRCGARVFMEPRRGYGAACKHGIAQLHDPDVVLFMDGDFSDYPEEAAALVDPIIAGRVDLVVGSRVLGQREPGALAPQALLGNWLTCKLMRLFWKVRYTDLGPFRAISFSALKRLRMSDPDYGWTVEMQIKAARDGLKVMEVPVSYRKRIGRSKVSGTVKGVIGAGTKILGAIFLAAIGSLPRHSKADDSIVLFTRYPVRGKTKTRLIPALGPDGAADLQRRMTEHIVARARKAAGTRCATLEVRYEGGAKDEVARWLGDDVAFAEQGAGDIGTRMHVAFKAAFQKGVQKVILIGSDCPGITVALLQNALDALSDCDLVLGPAADGGYYLIGLKRPCPPLFGGIAWGSPQVMEQTLAVANDLGLVVKLTNRLNDVDRPEDLIHLAEIPLETSVSSSCIQAGDCPRISVIIPTLNEEQNILPCLERVFKARDTETIVVDGGSMDRTQELARSAGARVLEATPGRASQMNAGAFAAVSEVLLFLHADTLLPEGWADVALAELNSSGVVAVAFTLSFSSRTWALTAIEKLANLRSRLFQMPYGDQAIAVRADLFHELGGFRDLPIMEDWDLISRLRKRGRIRTAATPIVTSPRRWETSGVLRTTALNQIIILGYVMGISPSRLARLYDRNVGCDNIPRS